MRQAKKTFGVATVGTLNRRERSIILWTDDMMLHTPTISSPKQLCLEVYYGECLALPTAAGSG